MIDNELDGDAKARLPARLVQDEAMRERYDALREAGRSIAIAWMLCSKRRRFLKFAPVSRRRTPSGWLSGIGLRELAAGIAACVLAAGAGASFALSLAPGGGNKDWRSAVLESPFLDPVPAWRRGRATKRRPVSGTARNTDSRAFAAAAESERERERLRV
jgi:hypothetical protein